MSSSSRFAALLLGIAFCSCGAQAIAQPGDHPALHWSRGEHAEACVDPKSLAERIETLTGPVLAPPAEADLSIEAHVEALEARGFRVRITVTSMRGAPSGERVLDFVTSDCRTIDAAVALTIATLIDPALGSNGLPEEVLAMGTDETPPEQALAAELAHDPPKATPQPLRAEPRTAALPIRSVPATDLVRRPFQLGLGAMAGSGLLPGFAVGILGRAAWIPSPWLGLELQGDGRLLPRAAPVDGVRSLQAQAFGVAVLACTRLALSDTWSIRTGVGPEFERLIAHGHGFSTDQQAKLNSFGARGLLGVAARIDEHWALGVEALAQLRFSNKHFVYQRIAETYIATGQQRISVSLVISVLYTL